MWNDPASVALIALAAICGTLATVGLLRRAQQGRAARRAAEGPDRAVLREYRQLQRELAELVAALDAAADRLADRLEQARPPRSTSPAARQDRSPDDGGPSAEHSADAAPTATSALSGMPALAVKECIENVKRYAESA